MQERLQKIISRAGIASRRKAEELIVQGLVSVNGEIVSELGAKADPQTDVVKVQGKPINRQPPKPIYLLLNKPKGYVTTTDDPEGRPTVMDLVGRYRKSVYPVGRLDYSTEGLLLLTNDGDLANRLTSAKYGIAKSVYPVGRLDYSTEGLLLLTNDGDLANRLTSAKYGIAKTYNVKVTGLLSAAQLDKFRGGIRLDGRMTAPAKIRMIKAATNPWYEVVLTQGRNRQIRRMFQRLGPLVEKIRRVKLGPLTLRGVDIGQVRPLTERELEKLKRTVEREPPTRAPEPRP